MSTAVPWMNAWSKRAACLNVPVEVFYPPRGGDVRPAKRICQTCPVTAECLEYAMANDEREGIWGGTSGYARRQLRRQAS